MDFYQAVFYGIGFIILLSLYPIFRKLSFQLISLVQYPVFLVFLYSYIGPKFSIRNLSSLLLTSQVSSAGGVIQVQRRRSIQICCGLSYISFLKAQSLYIVLAQQIVLIQDRIRFSIIMLISFIKEGVKGGVLGQISCLLYILSYKPKQASYFLLKIILQLLRSVIRKGILYYLRLLTRRCIYKILIIGYPTYLLYSQIGISLGRSSISILRKLASFIVYQALIRVKAFTLELAKVEVKT